MKKPRHKRYHPKPVTRLGGLDIIAGRIVAANPLDDEEQTEIVTDYHVAVQAITEGRAEGGHFDTLVYALNIALVLAERGIGDEYIESLIVPAIAAMHRCSERHGRTGKIGLDGEGLRAVCAAADLHQAQMEVATAGELRDAIAEMHRRIAKQRLEAARQEQRIFSPPGCLS